MCAQPLCLHVCRLLCTAATASAGGTVTRPGASPASKPTARRCRCVLDARWYLQPAGGTGCRTASGSGQQHATARIIDDMLVWRSLLLNPHFCAQLPAAADALLRFVLPPPCPGLRGRLHVRLVWRVQLQAFHRVPCQDQRRQNPRRHGGAVIASGGSPHWGPWDWLIGCAI